MNNDRNNQRPGQGQPGQQRQDQHRPGQGQPGQQKPQQNPNQKKDKNF